MMSLAQVVETSVNVITNSPSQDYTHPDDHNFPIFLLYMMVLGNSSNDIQEQGKCYRGENNYGTSGRAKLAGGRGYSVSFWVKLCR